MCDALRQECDIRKLRTHVVFILLQGLFHLLFRFQVHIYVSWNIRRHLWWHICRLQNIHSTYFVVPPDIMYTVCVNAFVLVPVLLPLSFFPILMATGFSGVMNSRTCCYWCHTHKKNTPQGLKIREWNRPFLKEWSWSVTSLTLNGAPLSFTVNSVLGSIWWRQMERTDWRC